MVLESFPFSGHYAIRWLEERDLSLLEWHGGADWRAFYHNLWPAHQNGELSVLIADFAEFPAGMLVIHWAGKPAHLNFPDQQSLRVHPALRGLGVGSQLIRTSESVVAQRGFSCAGLSVSIQNHAARRLYERLGYSQIHEPYQDRWCVPNARGEEVWFEETVVDLVKSLSGTPCL